MPYLDTRVRHLRSNAKRDGGESLNRFLTVMIQPPPKDKLFKLDHGNDRYRYKFKPAPRQIDSVIRCIMHTIKEMSNVDLGVANMNFRVFPITNAPPFWPQGSVESGISIGMKMYTFLDDYNEFPATTFVTVIPISAGLSTDTLYIKIGLDWVLLKNWLLSKRSSSEYLIGKKGLKAQRKWWRNNGQKFPIMKLPTECRLIILKHALGPRLYPLSTAALPRYLIDYITQTQQDAKVHWGFGFNFAGNRHGGMAQLELRGYREDTTAKNRSTCEPNLAVLHLCKQVHREALEAGWQNTREWFFSPYQLQTVLRAGRTPNYN
jgi:hypothetical protein